MDREDSHWRVGRVGIHVFRMVSRWLYSFLRAPGSSKPAPAATIKRRDDLMIVCRGGVIVTQLILRFRFHPNSPTSSDPVVSRNSITTEGADFRSVGRGCMRTISDRAWVFGDCETPSMNMMKLMARGGRAQPAAGGRDRLCDYRERLGGLLRYYYRDAA